MWNEVAALPGIIQLNLMYRQENKNIDRGDNTYGKSYSHAA